MVNSGHSNVRPVQPGEIRNPNGRPKGSKNWSTIVKDILNDKKIFEAIIKDSVVKPAWLEMIPKNKKNGANAIAIAMMTKAVSGDKQAADWLRKTGFGDMLDITSDDKPLEMGVIGYVIPRPTDDKPTS